MTWLWLVILAAAALPLGLFVYYYARYSPWRSTLQGKTLMAQKIAMLAVLVHAGFSATVNYPGERIVGMVLFLILMILFWVMFISLRIAQTSGTSVKGVGFAHVEPEEEKNDHQ